MNPELNTDLRYPIGRFSPPASISPQDRNEAIKAIAEFPGRMRAAVHGLSEPQLDTAYREDGWTVRQTVHHTADSHMQASSRVRLSLTEDWPTIWAYKENLWAELADARTFSVDVSLQILDALHSRWVVLLRALDEADWKQRGYKHPVNGKQALEQVTMLYAWHGRHHTAQITALRQRQGW